VSILEQFERDLLAVARERLPVEGAPRGEARATARARRRWLRAVVPAFSVGVAVAVAAVALLSLHSASTGGSARQPAGRAGPEQSPRLSLAYAPIARLLAGVPQSGARLGAARAPVSVVLFGDLESPVSGMLARRLLPALIRGPVRSGVVKLTFRALCTSTCAGPGRGAFDEQQMAALAAGRQHLFWNYALLMFADQGRLGTDYATTAYLGSLAKQIPELNLAQWRRDRELRTFSTQLTDDAHAAAARRILATPTLVITGPQGHARTIVGMPTTLSELTVAIQRAQ
jgi:protein-disulfide isomerase